MNLTDVMTTARAEAAATRVESDAVDAGFAAPGTTSSTRPSSVRA